jgi:alcohol dehydrogenase
MFDIPHGVVCGTLMASANEINVRELRKRSDNTVALRKYALLGNLFLDGSSNTDGYYIDGFIDYLHKLTSDLSLPGLKKWGLEKADFELICSSTDIKNNPVKLDKPDLIEILEGRLF